MSDKNNYNNKLFESILNDIKDLDKVQANLMKRFEEEGSREQSNIHDHSDMINEASKIESITLTKCQLITAIHKIWWFDDDEDEFRQLHVNVDE